MSPRDCCRGEVAAGGHPRGMHTQTCKVYLANCETWERVQAQSQARLEWQPGDPVHPAEPAHYGSCGPCLVRWTAPVDRCPECGELSTEALRTAVVSSPELGELARLRDIEQAARGLLVDVTRQPQLVHLGIADLRRALGDVS